MYRYIFTLLTTCLALTIQAQTFLDNLRQTEAGQGKVTIIQSEEIDKLVNGTETPQTSPNPVTTSKDSNNDKTSHSTTGGATANKKQNATESASNHADNHPATSGDDVVTDNRKKVMRNSYKTQGYRIQVYSGGNSRNDKNKASAIGSAMKAHFPTEAIYVHFYSPSWKCRMGNYKTLEEAREILSQVKSLGYTQACIVKGTISVQY